LDYFGAALFTVGLVLILTGIVYSIFLKSSDPKIVASLGKSRLPFHRIDLQNPLNLCSRWLWNDDIVRTLGDVCGFEAAPDANADMDP